MANKQNLYTFHQVREQCPQSSPEAWRSFFKLYAPLALQLLRMYSLDHSPAWEETIDLLVRDDFQRFRAMPQQSEREFLIELRAEILNRAVATTEGDAQAGEGQSRVDRVVDLERMGALLEGLPLLHQEIVWLSMVGYTEATIETMLRVSPAVARSALDRILAAFPASAAPAGDGCLWPRDWLNVLREARALNQKECPPLHQLLRIHDGQVSWYDKEPVEKRVGNCRHCLENWTGLREVAYWRLAAPPVSPEQIEAWLRRVPLKETKKKALFQRSSGS